MRWLAIAAAWALGCTQAKSPPPSSGDAGDPLGGAAAPYWEPINSVYKLNIVVANPTIDPTFSFMTVDHDGKIRMDCSSPYAMARLVGLKNQFQVAFGNDPDSDRHGIVTPSAGLMNPEPASCDWTVLYGPRTKTAQSWTCCLRKFLLARARILVNISASWYLNSGFHITRASTPRRHPSRKLN